MQECRLMGQWRGFELGELGVNLRRSCPQKSEKSPMDLVVACKDGKVMMVEAGAKEVPEEMIIEAMHWAVEECTAGAEICRETCARR